MSAVPTPLPQIQAIAWCNKHWADLMHALNERGFGNQIAPDAEALSAKFTRGEYDPCWDACNRVNIAAIQIFGPQRIVEEYKGCPACAFAHMVGYVTDLIAFEHGDRH